MNADEMTFGVEIETHIPHGVCRVGGHGCGIQVPWLPAGWLADGDPSIRPPAGRQGCEFVSPILKGADGLRQLIEVVAEIKRRGGKVNDSCGIHVHVGFDKTNEAAVERLLALVANHEKAIYAVTGTKNRERGIGSRYGTCWCESVKRFGDARTARTDSRGPSHYRYNVVNLTSENPTAEFRAFSGSLNATKIVGYVRLCIGIAQKAATARRMPSFNTKASPARNRQRFTGGVGHAELIRMMYAIGWRKNGAGTKCVYGVVEGDGIPSIAQTNKILRQMANQYDRQP